MANPILQDLRGQPITSPTILNNLPSYSPKTSFNMSGLLAGLGGALIGGIGSLFSQHSQNKFNAQQAALNRQFIADENAKAFDRNWNQMLYQNDYNSPANQRKLYEQAGINYQNIVGGTGGTSVSKSGNAASPSGGASTPAAAPLQMEWANNIANIGLIKAQTEKTKAEANAIDSTTEGHVKSLDLINQWQEQTNKILDKYGMKSAYLDNELKDTQVVINTMQEGLIRIEKMLKEGDLYIIQPKLAANIAADTAVKAAQEANLNENTKLTKQEREQREKDFGLRCGVFGATIAQLYASARANNSLPGLYSKLGNVYENSAKLLNTQNHQAGLDYVKDFDIFSKYWKDYTDLLKNQLGALGLHYGLRNPNGGFWNGVSAGFFTTVDEAKGFVNVGFNRSSFVGNTSSQSVSRSYSNSESYNHNFNHSIQ